MKPLVTIIALCFSLGLSLSTSAQEGKAVAKNEIPNDAIGQVCEIVRKDADRSSNETEVGTISGKITGKVVRFDNDIVVLVDASRTGRIERGVPILSSIPYLKRMFKNTAIVEEKVPGELTVYRREIRSIKFRGEKGSGAVLVD